MEYASTLFDTNTDNYFCRDLGMVYAPDVSAFDHWRIDRLCDDAFCQFDQESLWTEA